MIYFMRICNSGVLLVSNGKISCDLIHVCSDHELDTHDLRYTYNIIYNMHVIFSSKVFHSLWDSC